MNLTSIKVPGRINLIGEHTDYTQGYVLPVAINLFTEISFTKFDDFKIESLYFNEVFYFEKNKIISILNSNKIDDLKKEVPTSKSHWLYFIFGVMYYFNQIHKIDKGFSICIDTTIPIGSGMSSSASLNIAIIEFLEYYTGHKLDDLTAVKLSKRVENEFIGIQSGLLDPVSIRNGKKNTALFFKCDQRINIENIKLDDRYQFLVIDTLVRRELKDSKYNQRVDEAKSIEVYIKEKLKLGDITNLSLQELEKIKTKIEVSQYLRAKHIINENNRVKEFVKALKMKNDASIFNLLYSSHNSLKDNFDVSWEEANFIIDLIHENFKDSELGGRMMGGGFGGCVLIIYTNFEISKMTKLLDKSFYDKYKCKLKFHFLKASEIQYIE